MACAVVEMRFCVVFGFDGGGPGGGGGLGVKYVSVEVELASFFPALLRVLLAGPVSFAACCCVCAEEVGGSLMMCLLCLEAALSSIIV